MRIGRAWAITMVLLVGLAAIAQWAPEALAGTSTPLEAALIAAAIVLSVLGGVTGIMSWQLTGDARSFRTGLALLVLGGAGLGLGGLAPLVDPHWSFGGPAIAAGAIVALGFSAVALVRPEVDTLLRPGRAVLIAVALLIILVPWFESLGSTGGSGAVAARLLGIAAFATLAVASWMRGTREHRGALTWSALTWFGFALVTVVAPAAGSADDAHGAALMIAIVATAASLIGNAGELARAYVAQRASRFEAEVNAELARTRIRTERAARDEQLHDTRSAILAIQSATRALGDHINEDGIDAAERARLATAIDAELTRVRELIRTDPVEAVPESFSLRNALVPLVLCQRSRGREIELDVPLGVKAFAVPAAVVEIVENLIDNAADHAPGSPVTVRTTAEPDRVCVHVDDVGPGVPEHSRLAVFERGVTTSGRHDGGLGLFVAQRLARESGGDLRVEDGPGGLGASFVLCLPSAGRAESGEHPTQGRDVAELHFEDVVRDPQLERGAHA